MIEPQMPERTRLMRPTIWANPDTASLPGPAFRLYLGLVTASDDDGYLLWRPAALAAYLYRYETLARRTRLLYSGATAVGEAGLLALYPCGCGFLPFMGRDFRISGGNHSTVVRAFHLSHRDRVESVPVSPSQYLSFSFSFSCTYTSSLGHPAGDGTEDTTETPLADIIGSAETLLGGPRRG